MMLSLSASRREPSCFYPTLLRQQGRRSRVALFLQKSTTFDNHCQANGTAILCLAIRVSRPFADGAPDKRFWKLFLKVS